MQQVMINDSIEVSCSKSNLKAIRQFVAQRLAPLDLSDNEINMIVLAVDEICSNLIIHSNKCDEQEVIRLAIKLEKKPSGLLFEIIDYGRAFDYSDYNEPSIKDIVEEKKKGSIGLMLVRRIMDQIEFRKENTYNLCRMFKKIDPVRLAS